LLCLFLVDTAATSFLNLKTFAKEVRARLEKDFMVTALSQPAARGNHPQGYLIGNTKLNGLRCPPWNLSAAAKACGERIRRYPGSGLAGEAGRAIDLKKADCSRDHC